ncbi:TolC family protein [Metapseudomonas otitidis]|uniref:TolC family protein n=1 Tax=Metapseudomonas otitidis TaxID=319939 RepID=UPI001980DEAD|nr:TolC family protein [Pseudomonas otitidis]
MHTTKITHARSMGRHRGLRILLLAMAGGLLLLPQGLLAQPVPREVPLKAARDVTLSAADDAPKQAASAPAAHPVAAPAKANGNGRVTASSSQVKAYEGRSTVHFSEWLKDNPDAARRRSTGSVQENEIRAILAGALNRAIDRSPLLRQTHAEQAAAAADVREAQGQRWPQIDVGANSQPVSLGGASNDSANPQAITLNMTTNVFDWGRTSKTIDSRKELNSAADQKYLANLETLARDVSVNVVELEKNRRVSAISLHYVERMSTLVGMLKEIVTTDRGRSSELTQARARLMEAQASLDASRARERDNEIKLRKLIGDAPVKLPENGDWALVSANLNDLLAAAQQHPALRQAEHEANASERHAESLRAGEKPQLNWVVTKTTGEDQLGREQPWQTMVTVNWPLFRGGSARAAREAALMRAEAERERKAQQQLDLEFETRTAEQDANTLLARADLYRNLTSETDAVRKAFFEQWYHLGRRTLLDVLIAESDHNNNLINEVSNRFDGYQAILKAYASAGQLTQWLYGSQN